VELIDVTYSADSSKGAEGKDWMNNNSRLLVVGVDGCTWNLLGPWIDKGYLPTFKKVKDAGCFGKLTSTFQSDSASAWASFATGMYPHKHGLTGFLVRDPQTRSLELMNSTLLETDTLWKILSRYGLKIGVINLPIAYPVMPINGFMVGGMLAPSLNRLTYPPDLHKEITSVAEYVIDTSRSAFRFGPNGDQDYCDYSLDSLRQRGKAVSHLMRTKVWDVLVAVFTETDRVQHYFWADMDENHHLHASKSGRFKNVILDHYKLMDSILAELMEIAGQTCNVLVVSDHGFAGAVKRFYLNNWLREKGYLAAKKARGRNISKMLRRIALRLPLSVDAKNWMFSHIRRGLREFMVKNFGEEENGFKWELIDWEETQAYADVDRGIHIKAEIVKDGAKYKSLRDRIRSQLMDVTDPETGENVIANVMFREELYGDGCSASLPDLIIQPQQDVVNCLRNYGELAVGPTTSREFLLPLPYNLTGAHIRDGVFLACGDKIRKFDHELQNVSIIDIAPTILSLVGLGEYKNMDGRVLDEILAETEELSRQRRLNRATEGMFQVLDNKRPFTNSEKKTLSERLRQLGYLE
jgi:predicted AlkP superfamily phosphohydrolase/phosphomutase